jgi:hypothetical protein
MDFLGFEKTNAATIPMWLLGTSGRFCGIFGETIKD